MVINSSSLGLPSDSCTRTTTKSGQKERHSDKFIASRGLCYHAISKKDLHWKNSGHIQERIEQLTWLYWYCWKYFRLILSLSWSLSPASSGRFPVSTGYITSTHVSQGRWRRWWWRNNVNGTICSFALDCIDEEGDTPSTQQSACHQDLYSRR